MSSCSSGPVGPEAEADKEGRRTDGTDEVADLEAGVIYLVSLRSLRCVFNLSFIGQLSRAWPAVAPVRG